MMLLCIAAVLASGAGLFGHHHGLWLDAAASTAAEAASHVVHSSWRAELPWRAEQPGGQQEPGSNGGGRQWRREVAGTSDNAVAAIAAATALPAQILGAGAADEPGALAGNLQREGSSQQDGGSQQDGSLQQDGLQHDGSSPRQLCSAEEAAAAASEGPSAEAALQAAVQRAFAPWDDTGFSLEDLLQTAERLGANGIHDTKLWMEASMAAALRVHACCVLDACMHACMPAAGPARGCALPACPPNSPISPQVHGGQLVFPRRNWGRCQWHCNPAALLLVEALQRGLDSRALKIPEGMPLLLNVDDYSACGADDEVSCCGGCCAVLGVRLGHTHACLRALPACLPLCARLAQSAHTITPTLSHPCRASPSAPRRCSASFGGRGTRMMSQCRRLTRPRISRSTTRGRTSGRLRSLGARWLVGLLAACGRQLIACPH